MQRIVVIVELHDSTHEGVVGVADLLLVSFLIVLDRNHHSLFEQVSRRNNRISVKLTEVLHLLDPIEFLICLGTRLNVWISCTVVDQVTDLFAASAAYILLALLLVVVLLLVGLLIFVIFRLVHAELTSWLILANFTTAPPHLATVVALMHSARPIVVFLFWVLLATVLASLEATVKLALSLDELLDSKLRFLFLQTELLDGLLQVENVVLEVIVLLAALGERFLKFGFTLFAHLLVMIVLSLYLLLTLVDVAKVITELITLLNHSRHLLSHLPNLVSQFVVIIGKQLNLTIHFIA